MSEPQRSVSDRIRAWNEDGQLYFWGGIFSDIISWLLVPIFGLLGVYCGYQLYNRKGRAAVAGIIGLVGGIGVLIWAIFLVNIFLLQ